MTALDINLCVAAVALCTNLGAGTLAPVLNRGFEVEGRSRRFPGTGGPGPGGIRVEGHVGPPATARAGHAKIAQLMEKPMDSTADLATVKTRLRERILAGIRAGDPGSSVNQQRADGSWPDIDYADRGRARWAPAGHMSRLLALAGAFARNGKLTPEGKAAAQQAVEKGLRYWYAKDYRCPNWWYNTIGIPRLLYRILLIMEDDLPAEVVRGGIPLLARAKLGMTGQNLVWVAECTIARGCLEGKPGVVREAFDRIAREIRITGGEGIQADFSFHQHGNQLYSGGYGRGFSRDCPYFAALARGTAFAFPEEKIDILAGYLLDGQQWLVRNRVFDYSACGREITRSGGGYSSGLGNACRDLARLDHPRGGELEAFAKRLEKGTGPETPALNGNRHFWRSDLMAHHRDGFYTSVRMTSKRLIQTETCNGENLIGQLLSDGVNYLYLTGEEYRHIFPVWDWKRLPGITAELDGKPPRTRGGTGTRTFAGGVSDGDRGLAAMDFARGALSARKAWFFFDREFVCLGAGISCANPNPVVTTLNQCLLNGEIRVGEGTGAGRIVTGEQRISGARWCHHGGVGYVFPRPVELAIQARSRKGTWRTINRPASKAPVRKDVFCAWIEHGKGPRNAAYAYIVAPGLSAERIGEYARSPGVKVVRNEPDLQAVWHPGERTAGLAFYGAGSCELPAWLTVAADTPCLVLLREIGPGKLRMAVSNPENEPLVVTLTVNAELAGEGCVWRAETGRTAVEFRLPGGLHAGSSVIREFRTAAR